MDESDAELPQRALEMIEALLEQNLPAAWALCNQHVERAASAAQTIPVLCLRGTAERWMGRRLDAIASLQSCLASLSQEGREDIWFARTHLQLSAIHASAQELELAEHHLELARARFAALGDVAGMLQARVFAAMNLGLADREPEALSEFEQCERSYSEIEPADPIGHGACLINWAVALRALGQSAEATKLLGRALSLGHAFGSFRLQTLALIQLAGIEREQGARSQATRHASDAVANARRMGFAFGAALANHALAGLAEDDGLHDEAERLTEAAHREAYEAGAYYLANGIEADWSERCARRGDLAGALSHLQAHMHGRLALMAQNYSNAVQHTQARHLLAMAQKHGEALEAEIAARTAEIHSTLARLQAEVARRQIAEAALSHLAQHDPLTGCLRRHCLAPSLADFAPGQASHALVFLDLQGFKALNERLGNAAGDQLLADLGGRLRATAPGRPLIRYGGDEFILLIGEQELADAEAFAQRIREAVVQPYALSMHDARIDCHLGISATHTGVVSAEQLLQEAEIALQASQAGATNKFMQFSAVLDASHRRAQQIRAQLPGAAPRGELYLRFQPIQHVADWRVSGYEALVRWVSPALGEVAPGEFIPHAERSGEVIEIGAWVLEAACKQLATLNRTMGLRCSVAVNASAQQFQHPGFEAQILHALGESGLDPTLLKIEITETSALERPDETGRLINALRRRGIDTYLDDFGAGYANLARLIELPIAGLKIDMSLTARISESQRVVAVIDALVRLAHASGIVTVAEGVQTSDQVELLRQLGCQHLQGSLIGPPARLTELLVATTLH
ncbi:EAL domain-containing protein [Niveibacterium sp. 24ML]|uniref:GGDEF domain-containing phosphodiesterase n=1 Tax=Niveibacterium sp. 24ML TaxID=2985512 RepID=UPI00226D44B5|nr:GGDEF domain-containing phosphodiesterase [Niveibacterium sp. 24ML]MCX9154660.1 EAL domain-containing protein [Niveibacterium sp. 24ML]